MRAWTSTLLAAAATFTLAGAAAAQEQPLKEPAEAAAPEDTTQEDGGDFDVSFNVGVASDYVFRGISQTDEGGQLFGGIDIAMPDNVYAGAWVSNVDFSAFGDTETNVEADFYIGVKPEIAGFVADFAAIYYAYFNQPATSAELGYFEAKAALSRAIGPASVGGALYYSPEFTGETGQTLYYELNGAYTISERFSASAAVGRQTYSDIEDADYTTWNIGATVVLTPNIGLDIRYWDTDEDDLIGSAADLYEGRAVASLKATF